MLYSHLCSPESEASVPSAETALRAFTLHGRLSVHLQHAVRPPITPSHTHTHTFIILACVVKENQYPTAICVSKNTNIGVVLEVAASVSGTLTHRFVPPQVSEGRDHLASLENMAAWVAERVLPFLVRSGEAGSAEGQLELARRVVEVRSIALGYNTRAACMDGWID